MCRALLLVVALAACVAIGVGVWAAWPRTWSSPSKPGLDLDEWERLSQQYHRSLPTGKALVEIRLPVGVWASGRHRTYHVTVNGTPP